jgi:hypothetical protein
MTLAVHFIESRDTVGQHPRSRIFSQDHNM